MLELDTSSIQRISKVIIFCGASLLFGCDDGAGKPGAASDGGCDTLRYLDSDGDNYGNPDLAERRCDAEGWVTRAGDCDDEDASINPGAVEICDAADVDEDCDGFADDENAQDAEYWFYDNDGDGYGAGAPSGRGCDPGAGEVANDSDCDDDDPEVSPGLNERCDDKDNDCNGEVDDGEIVGGIEAGAGVHYLDADNDGWGTATAPVTYLCSGTDGLVVQSGDCDDTDMSINPDAVDECGDAIDQDCDGFLDNRCETLHMTSDADWTLPYPEDDDPEELRAIILEASDLTGDGIDDLLIGYGSRYMQLLAGPIADGTEPMWTVDFPEDALAAGFGLTVDTDVNGDGEADMVVPVLTYDTTPSIMVFHGPFIGAPDWSSPAHRLELDSAYSLAGVSGLSAADFTGDGAVDLAFDTYGAGNDVYIWDDISSSATAFLGSDHTFSWPGAHEGSLTGGFSVGPSKGDFNGDGQADMVHIGSDSDDLALLFGPISRSLETVPDVILSDSSTEAPRSFTKSLCIADFDGDGHDEIGVAAWRISEVDPVGSDDMESESEGVELWVFDLESPSEPVFKLTEGDNAQQAIYTCTDVDGDGQTDILMQRPWAMNSVGYVVGAVHLFFGSVTGTRSEDSADHVFMSESVDNLFGSLTTTGDHDDDGYNDLIISGTTSDTVIFSSEDWLSGW